MGRPPGKPDTRIVLQEFLWPLREFIYVNLSEYHFHRGGVGYCECSDFAAAFTEDGAAVFSLIPAGEELTELNQLIGKGAVRALNL